MWEKGECARQRERLLQTICSFAAVVEYVKNIVEILAEAEEALRGRGRWQYRRRWRREACCVGGSSKGRACWRRESGGGGGGGEGGGWANVCVRARLVKGTKRVLPFVNQALVVVVEITRVSVTRPVNAKEICRGVSDVQKLVDALHHVVRKRYLRRRLRIGRGGGCESEAISGGAELGGVANVRARDVVGRAHVARK